MLRGTCYFQDRFSLIHYYCKQGFGVEEVNEKLENGEVKIGKPKLKDGEVLEIIPGEGRYAIRDGGGEK